ncbi:hypothetical protein [Aliarcobacter butzleri]|uniref:hypothetical protein n=1 Tax=Aliarcobacter butzleri TaxID=28197 RepID=UPI002B250F1B|nr:hypothetical protein [Aliarcobacter butzleri]
MLVNNKEKFAARRYIEDSFKNLEINTCLYIEKEQMSYSLIFENIIIVSNS